MRKIKMKIVEENILIEEINSLLKGNSIDFITLKNGVKIKISGKELVKPGKELSVVENEVEKDIKDMNNKELTELLRKELTSNILERYDNSEYWDHDLIEQFEADINEEKKFVFEY